MSLKQFLAARHIVVRPEGREHAFDRWLKDKGHRRQVTLELSHFMNLLAILPDSDLSPPCPTIPPRYRYTSSHTRGSLSKNDCLPEGGHWPMTASTKNLFSQAIRQPTGYRILNSAKFSRGVKVPNAVRGFRIPLRAFSSSCKMRRLSYFKSISQGSSWTYRQIRPLCLLSRLIYS